MTELSLAAQTVLNAAEGVCMYRPDPEDTRLAAAAALRAAADQVVPESFTYDSGSLVDGAIEFEQGQECRNGVVRAALLAIADELENAQ